MIRRRVLNYLNDSYPKAFSLITNCSDSDSQFCYIEDSNKEFMLINHQHLSHIKILAEPDFLNNKRLAWFEEFTQELNTDYNISDDIFIKKPKLLEDYISIFRRMLKIFGK